MGTKWTLGLLALVNLSQGALFPNNKKADDITRGLAINLTFPSNGQIKIDSMFQEKADQSWKPQSRDTHIATFRTNRQILAKRYASELYTILRKGSDNVSRLRTSLENYSKERTDFLISILWAKCHCTSRN